MQQPNGKSVLLKELAFWVDAANLSVCDIAVLLLPVHVQI